MPHATTSTSNALLDLEREAFASLLGERKTLERISTRSRPESAAKLMPANPSRDTWTGRPRGIARHARSGPPAVAVFGHHPLHGGTVHAD
jgi:hypothetical protein